MDTEKKLRIYFDTTIPNMLFADDRPDWKEATWRLWERCVAGEYEIFVSDLFFEELNKCSQPKLRNMYEQLSLIQFEQLEESDEARELSDEYVSRGAFVPSSSNDSLHVALAVAQGCDLVLSWNFHQTRPWTIGIINEVNLRRRYKDIRILQPDEFLEGDYQ